MKNRERKYLKKIKFAGSNGGARNVINYRSGFSIHDFNNLVRRLEERKWNNTTNDSYDTI